MGKNKNKAAQKAAEPKKEEENPFGAAAPAADDNPFGASEPAKDDNPFGASEPAKEEENPFADVFPAAGKIASPIVKFVRGAHSARK